jgi:hypothetical protein
MSNRRQFITLIGGAAAWPLAAGAQQAGRLPIIGYLGPGLPDADAQRVAALVQRLRELGWVENRNLTIERRWADNREGLFAEIAKRCRRRALRSPAEVWIKRGDQAAA